jgi:hypothetical protein
MVNIIHKIAHITQEHLEQMKNIICHHSHGANGKAPDHPREHPQAQNSQHLVSAVDVLTDRPQEHRTIQ